MKELTIEEKAQRYDKAIEKFDIILNLNTVKESGTIFADDVRKIFPELKESEDERIRKWLIHYFKEVCDNVSEKEKKGVIDWLEKHGEQNPIMIQWQGNNLKEVIDFVGKDKNFGKWFKSFEEYERYVHEHNNIFKLFNKDGSHYEVAVGAWIVKTPDGYNVASKAVLKQKPTDKIEPKFHEGDWVILTTGKLSATLQIVNVDTNKKLYWFNDSTYLPIVDEECLHLWTIKEARDGDVLCCESGWTCIFKTLGNDETFSSYCFMDNTKWFCETGSECHTLNKEFTKAYNGEIKPATKEQRDLFFAKMKGAGYEWYYEKKELKKIEHNPAWSEGDDIMIHDIDYALRCHITYPISKLQSMSTWINNLKNRIQSQNFTVTDTELAQAKKDAYNDALNKIEYHSGESTFDDGWSAAIWYLKKKNAQPKQEWSSEDKENLLDVKCIIDEVWHKEETEFSSEKLESLWYWLDNLWKRVKYLQNTWNPTDKQIIALRWVLNNIPYDSHKEEISGLLEQLNKLKEK